MNDRIEKTRELGQSFWIDLLHREVIESGTLQEYIDYGIAGATSNPDSFAKGITETNAYDEDIKAFAERGLVAEKAYERMTVQDIQAGADLFLPVYEKTQGLDGYISLEVSPFLAFDPDKTIEEAVRLHGLVDRPNLMVKVPGTPDGMLAIEELTARGINVNVTLLFSVDLYVEAARTHVRGITRLADEDVEKARSVRSVASFFLSRFDVLLDPQLQEIVDKGGEEAGLAERLLGKAGVAAGKRAYAKFEEIFGGEEFASLKDQGIHVQRPLWASTRTKDPAYSDVKYVEPLIGPHTVNTLATVTIQAFMDHGEPQDRVRQAQDAAEEVFKNLEKIGFSEESITDRLLEEGVEKFSASHRKALETLAQKLE